MMYGLHNGLTSRNGFVRKGARALLAIPKWVDAWRADRDDFLTRPPVLANSFPKSGTHLLAQIVEGLPDRANFGAFLGSEISSFRFHERTAENTCRFINGFVPGEIVRGHLFFDPRFAVELAKRNTVHYFIYRDPRDVVVSEAHYLREMNRWHRLAPHFRRLPSIEEAVMLSINGFDPPRPGIDYPNIAARFARYRGWLDCDDCLAFRFEDLRSGRQAALMRELAEFYARRCGGKLDVDRCVESMAASIAPEKSHTFRSGKKSGWQREFTAEHCRRFNELAGNLLIELGYEPDHDWAKSPVATSA
jgi:Sulfotransferase domain